MIEPTHPIVPEAPEKSPASQDYWREMSGHTYRRLIEGREAAGQDGYRLQEEILTRLVSGEQRRLNRRLQLLEFGCGFGRHAWYLSALENVDYHGYDFSEEMVSPLRQLAPPAMQPLSERLFVGADPVPLLGESRFDMILTVSVLIHNPPSEIGRLLEAMRGLLRPGGCVCLVENQLVPFTVYENDWHRGCWLHRYLDAIGDDWDVEVGHGWIGTHDVYLLRPNGGAPRRLFLLDNPERNPQAARPVDTATLDQLGIPKAKLWAASVEDRLRSPARSGTMFEAEEFLRAEREQLSRRQNFLALAQELAAIRAAAPMPSASSSERPPPSPARHRIELDCPSDTHWANPDPRFSRVVHLMHQEWHGIRAAASYLPGHKIAIPAERRIWPEEIKRALDFCSSTLARTVVLHGYSRNADELLHFLRKSFGDGVGIFAIWHGSTAQFHHDIEQEGLARLVTLKTKGQIVRLGAVKPGLHLLADAIERSVLLNYTPHRSGPQGTVQKTFGRAALIPVPVDWRKNFYTALLAAGGISALRTIFVTTDFKRQREFPILPEVVRLPFLDRWQFFRLLTEIDVAINTSLSECQPMVALEGLAFGVPCLTGSLGLGNLDQHPYQRRAQVARVDSVQEVRTALEHLIDMLEHAPAELFAEMRDYRVAHDREAAQRLGEFLRL
jgi:SAM-dependent methyltransferase